MKESKIYNTVFEELFKSEHSDIRKLSRSISREISKTIMSEQKRQVYEAVSNEWEQCGVIAKRCGIKSSCVSVVLSCIFEETTLIEVTRKNKNKLYRIAQ